MGRDKRKCIWFNEGHCRHFCTECSGACEAYQDCLKKLRDVKDIVYYQKVWEYYKRHGTDKDGFTGYEKDLDNADALRDISEEEKRLLLAFIDIRWETKRAFGFKELNRYLKDDRELLYELSPRLVDKVCRLYNRAFAGDRFLRLRFREDCAWVVCPVPVEYITEDDLPVTGRKEDI